jgi:hypothetical protein
MRAIHKVTTGLTLAAVAAIGGWTSRGLRPDGALERDEASREAGAGLAPVDTATDLRILLNLPAYRLEVLDRGAVTLTIPVAVGQPKYRTPLGSFRIDYAVWNPWWRPPDSYWARKERPQAPGWSNPVGRVKLHVTGLVFLHGTPLEDSRGSAASHACVRMSNTDAIALARLIHSRAGPPVSPALIDSLVADTSWTRTLTLSRSVPIDIVYRLAEVRSGELLLHSDVYRLAGKGVPGTERQAVVAIDQAGRDTMQLQRGRLRTLVRAARRAPVRIALDSLLTTSVSADADPPAY